MRETIMNPIHHIRRVLAVLAGLTAAGGMPGWQIALIAVGAALLAAALAVLADRVLAARRRGIPAAA
jgi:hypothetical protein